MEQAAPTMAEPLAPAEHMSCAYNCQKVKSKCRDRIWLERASQDQSRDTRKTLHDCRVRKIMKTSGQINDDTQYNCGWGNRGCASR
ncbi:hypothetical protein EVAR_62464_1 [Eumeta japonica]|uniref:Uncharacterized protein n=1 Tax=Eumeta variegata TaxID=151549 RepID=A0A4C1ZTL6_EUMVA|nr:hypothetical protein EVAR_62464_1 [Eumeta japonica]